MYLTGFIKLGDLEGEKAVQDPEVLYKKLK
jgi:hypothetical protein